MPAVKTRLAYSCTPCRTKKIRCDRHEPCHNCSRKDIACVWPENGVKITDNEPRATAAGRANRPPPSLGPRVRSTDAHLMSDPGPGPSSLASNRYAYPSTAVPPRPGMGPSPSVAAPLPPLAPTAAGLPLSIASISSTTSISPSAGSDSGPSSRWSGTVLPPIAQSVADAERYDNSIVFRERAQPPFLGSKRPRPHGGHAAPDPGMGEQQRTRSSWWSPPVKRHGGQDLDVGDDRRQPNRQNDTRDSGQGLPIKDNASSTTDESWGPGVNVELLQSLPSQVQCDRLFRCYLDLVDWIHHPLHLPTILAQYNDFWATPAAARATVPARWMALLYSILCLGALFGGEPCDYLARAAELCMHHSDYMSNHSMEAIQTIILLSIYLKNNDGGKRASMYMAIAIKMAMELGYSRVPPEDEVDDLSGVVEREMRRRLWWSLVRHDAYWSSSSNGLSYSINLTHATTGLPCNVDDEDFVEGKPLVPRPMEEMTAETLHIAKINFILVVREFIDAVNRTFPNLPYDAVLDLDRQFRAAFESHPRGLRYDLPQPLTLSTAATLHILQQRLFTGINLHHRLIRLHRIHMLRGYNDARYAYSTQVCLESAYTLLDLVWQSRRELLVWWVVLVHVWNAGVVIAVDMLCAPPHVDTGRQHAGVELAINLLEHTAARSPVARRGVSVLRGLLERRRDLGAAPGETGDLDKVPGPVHPSQSTVPEADVQRAPPPPVGALAPDIFSTGPDVALLWQALTAINPSDVQQVDWTGILQLMDAFAGSGGVETVNGEGTGVAEQL